MITELVGNRYEKNKVKYYKELFRINLEDKYLETGY